MVKIDDENSSRAFGLRLLYALYMHIVQDSDASFEAVLKALTHFEAALPRTNRLSSVFRVTRSRAQTSPSRECLSKCLIIVKLRYLMARNNLESFEKA